MAEDGKGGMYKLRRQCDVAILKAISPSSSSDSLGKLTYLTSQEFGLPIERLKDLHSAAFNQLCFARTLCARCLGRMGSMLSANGYFNE